jgi:hypothetical protein
MELSGTTRQVPKFYLIILFPLSISGKLSGTLSGFIARVKPAPSGLLCAWREVPILRQHTFWNAQWDHLIDSRCRTFTTSWMSPLMTCLQSNKRS